VKILSPVPTCFTSPCLYLFNPNSGLCCFEPEIHKHLFAIALGKHATFYAIFGFLVFLRVKAAMLSVRLSHRNSVRPSVCHTGGSGKNGPS